MARRRSTACPARSARPSRRRKSAPAPAVRQAPPPAQSGISGGAIIGSAIAEGMALAAGIEFARRVFGPRDRTPIKHETIVVAAPAPTPAALTVNCTMDRPDACNVHHSKAFPPEAAAPTPAAAPTANTMGGFDPCKIQSKAFQDCINNFRSDISKCQFYVDMLFDCRKNSSGMPSA